MSAPEKIYLNPLLMKDGESIVRRCTFERQRDSQIEYTRTDVFVEKVYNWLKYYTFVDDNNNVNLPTLLHDFLKDSRTF